jgi:hypothetical protein
LYDAPPSTLRRTTKVKQSMLMVDQFRRLDSRFIGEEEEISGITSRRNSDVAGAPDFEIRLGDVFVV